MLSHNTPPSTFCVVPTPLQTRTGGERLIVLEFPTARDPRPGRARLVLGGQVIRKDLGSIAPGETMAQVLLPEVSRPTPGEAQLELGESSWSATFTLAPARQWTVFLVPHSHTDIGFTHPASEVAAIHDENTDEAIALCDLTRGWPEGCRFKWTCEVSWQVQNYLRSRPPERIGRLQDCLRRGQMELAAVYAGLHTDICGPEELVRSLYFAAQLRRAWGIPVDTAMITDVPGATWAYAQVLAKAGIRYLVLADNNFSAPFLQFTDVPRPFYWLGPDGSRVLAWYTDDPYWSYIEGYKLGFDESYRHVLQALPLKLAQLEESGYPYAAFQLQMAIDNHRVSLRPALIAREWQEQWANPQVRLATAREFLAHMEQTQGSDLPARRGDWTNWWSSTVTGFPQETALGRRVKGELAAAEKLCAWAASAGPSAYPSRLIAEGYDKLLAFDEHSGGGGLWRPKSEEQQMRALYEGYAFPHEAARATAQALEAGLSALAGLVPNDGAGHTVLVANPLSWARSDVVDAELPPAVEAAAVLDPETGRALPVQALPSGKVRFVAPGVPPLGYKAFPLVPPVTPHQDTKTPRHPGASMPACEADAPSTGAVSSEKPGLVLEVMEQRIENRYYRLELDERGHIASILDKENDRELVDAAGPGFGQFLWYQPRPHREFGPGDEFPDQTELYEGLPVPGEILNAPDGDVQISIGSCGPVSANLVVERQVEGPFHLRQEITLHAGMKRVEVAYTLTRQADARAPKARQAYLHFPFLLEAPQFSLELPGAVLTPEEEQLTGACRDFMAAQHWVAIHNPGYTILVSGLDTPLVEPGNESPSHQQFIRRWQAQAAAVWFRALSLGPTDGAGGSPYTRGRPFVFRFALTSHAGPLQPVAAMHHGWGAFSPLLASVLPPGQTGALPPNQGSWCSVQPEQVALLTAKVAEDGDGLIFRLWEAAGRDCLANLSLPDLGGLCSAWRCNAVEEDIAPLEVTGGAVHVPMSEFGVETVRIRRQARRNS